MTIDEFALNQQVIGIGERQEGRDRLAVQQLHAEQFQRRQVEQTVPQRFGGHACVVPG